MKRWLGLALCLTAPLCRAGTIYVDSSATGAATGASWADAFLDVQPALDAAMPGDEIHVAEGTYIPSKLTVPDDPRSATYAIPEGVSVIGGFAAGGDQNAWDPTLHETVLSGEIGDPEVLSGNIKHVVTVTAEGVVVRGFTLTRAHAFPGNGGGGLLCIGGEASVEACRIQDNLAMAGAGAAVVNGTVRFTQSAFVANNTSGGSPALYVEGSDVTLTHCSVTDHYFAYPSTGPGGAVYVESGTLTCEDSVFANNATEGNGAAISSSGALALMRCVFANNSAFAGTKGGAVQSEGPSIVASDCQFIENFVNGTIFNPSNGMGGAVFTSSPVATFTDCEFRGNDAAPGPSGTGGYGAGVYVNAGDATFDACDFIGNAGIWGSRLSPPKGSAVSVQNGHAVLTDCLLRANSPEKDQLFGSVEVR